MPTIRHYITAPFTTVLITTTGSLRFTFENASGLRPTPDSSPYRLLLLLLLVLLLLLLLLLLVLLL